MANQANPEYTLTGRITNRQGEPLEGLIVRAYDQDPKTPGNLLGTDAVRRICKTGNFRPCTRRKTVAAIFGRKRPFAQCGGKRTVKENVVCIAS